MLTGRSSGSGHDGGGVPGPSGLVTIPPSGTQVLPRAPTTTQKTTPSESRALILQF